MTHRRGTRVTRSATAIALALLAGLAPAAGAAVQTGSGTDVADDGPIPARDLTALTVRHDTAAGTTVTVTLAAAADAATNAYAGVFLGRTDGLSCAGPSLTLIGFTDPASSFTPFARQSGSDTDLPTTRSVDGAAVTLSTTAVLPGGAEPDCARAIVGDANAASTTYDSLRSFTLQSDSAPPPPPPTTTTPTAPAPPPPVPVPVEDTSANGNPAGRFGGPFRVRQAVPRLTVPGRSYLYGVCRSFSICRVDPVTRKSRVILTGTKAKPYAAVTVSQSGATTSFDYDDEIYRAGRDGRRRAVWSKSGSSPALRADGRSVAWNQLITVPSCFPGVDFVLQCTYPLVPSLEIRSLGDKDSDTVETSVVTLGWYRDMLIVDQEPDGPELGNEYMCLVDAKGECGRAVAKDPARALSGVSTSPDGRTLAVVSEPATGADGRQRLRGRIELWNPANGKRLRNLTTGDRDANPVFSPDGTQVAFNRGTDVLVMPVRGGAPRLVARGLELTGPAWGLAR